MEDTVCTLIHTNRNLELSLFGRRTVRFFASALGLRCRSAKAASFEEPGGSVRSMWSCLDGSIRVSREFPVLAVPTPPCSRPELVWASGGFSRESRGPFPVGFFGLVSVPTMGAGSFVIAPTACTSYPP